MEDNTPPNVPAPVLDYLSSHSALTLATASTAGVPHAATMVYVNDGLFLYFCTAPDSVTARLIEQNPSVAFTVDDYTEDWSKTKGVQGSGQVEILLSPGEIASAAARFQQKFSLTGASTSNLSVFRIKPTSLQFIDNEQGGTERAGQALGMSYERTLVYSVFRDLPQRDVETVAGQLAGVQYGAGDVIVRQGAPADRFFIIVQGEVEVIHEDQGTVRTVAHLGPGQFFGEMAVLRDTPRTATVRAVVPVQLLAMDRDTFRSLVAQSLGTTEDFDRIVEERAAQLAGGHTG